MTNLQCHRPLVTKDQVEDKVLPSPNLSWADTFLEYNKNVLLEKKKKRNRKPSHEKDKSLTCTAESANLKLSWQTARAASKRFLSISPAMVLQADQKWFVDGPRLE